MEKLSIAKIGDGHEKARLGEWIVGSPYNQRRVGSGPSRASVFVGSPYGHIETGSLPVSLWRTVVRRKLEDQGQWLRRNPLQKEWGIRRPTVDYRGRQSVGSS